MNDPTNPALRPLSEAKPGAGPLIFYTTDFVPEGKPMEGEVSAYLGYVGTGAPGIWITLLGKSTFIPADGLKIGNDVLRFTHFAEPPAWHAQQFSPPPIGLPEIADDLADVVSTLSHQLEQVCQLHRYEDDETRQAQEDAAEALKRLDLYRKGMPPVTLYIARSENDLDVWSPEPIPGLEIVTLTWDIDDIRNYETGDVTMVRFPGADFEPCLVGHHVVTGSGRVPELRPATDEDMEEAES